MDFSKAGNGIPKIRECIFQNHGLDLLKSGNGLLEIRECFFFPQSVNLFPKIRECIPRNEGYISQNQGMFFPKRGNAPKLDSRRVRKPTLAAESSSPPSLMGN